MNYSFEIPINDFANSWYLHVNDSKCDYRIELAIDIMKHYSKKILDDEEVNDCLYILESFNQDNKKKKEQMIDIISSIFLFP